MSDRFTWKSIPQEEFDRLERTLYNHLRAMKVKKTKETGSATNQKKEEEIC